MTTKYSAKSKPFNCPRCGKGVARVSVIQHFTDESAAPIRDREIIDRVLGYGSCQVAATARVPGRPTVDELVECPVFKEY